MVVVCRDEHAVDRCIDDGDRRSVDRPARCGTRTFLAVRGTAAPKGSAVSSDGYAYKSTETGTPKKSDGYGNPGDPEFGLVAAIRKSVALPVYTESIKYPAAIFDPKSPLSPTYMNSVSAGISNLSSPSSTAISLRSIDAIALGVVTFEIECVVGSGCQSCFALP